MAETEIIVDGLSFPEGPRWRDGRLWFSDFFTQRVMTALPDGTIETVARLDDCPSGLGWLPDGRLLVVAMTERRLLRLEPEGPVTVAELADLAPHHCNDMVVDAAGGAYIGNFGFDYTDEDSVRPTVLIRVEPDGRASAVADELYFPNGMVITPDGSTLVVAETFAARLTAFTIGADGSLHDRRIWASLPDRHPDGICLDVEGAIWVASPPTREVVRVVEGGEVTDRIATERHAVACMLGGAERRTLFVLTARVGRSPEQALAERLGRIETVEVAVPGADRP